MNDMWGQGLDAELAYRRERMLNDLSVRRDRPAAQDGRARVVEVRLGARIRRAVRAAVGRWGLTRSEPWAQPR